MSSFRRPLQVQMPEVFEIVKGQKIIISVGEVKPVMASVQPPRIYDFDEVRAELGGARIDRVIMVTTGPYENLPVHDQHTGALACYFLWQGRRYKNSMVREGLSGVIPHMQYWAVQELEK